MLLACPMPVGAQYMAVMGLLFLICMCGCLIGLWVNAHKSRDRHLSDHVVAVQTILAVATIIFAAGIWACVAWTFTDCRVYVPPPEVNSKVVIEGKNISVK